MAPATAPSSVPELCRPWCFTTGDEKTVPLAIGCGRRANDASATEGSLRSDPVAYA